MTTRGFVLFFLILVTTTIASSGLAAANPGGFSVPAWWFVILALFLIVTNYPLNLAILLAFTYVALRIWGAKFFGQRGTRSLTKRVALGTIPISLLGGLIDGYLLFDGTLEISGDVSFWIRSLIAIFLSVLASLFFVAGLGLRSTFYAAVGLTAVNPVAWAIIRYAQDEHAVLDQDPVGIMIVLDALAIIASVALGIFISRQSARPPVAKADAEPQQEPGSGGTP